MSNAIDSVGNLAGNRSSRPSNSMLDVIAQLMQRTGLEPSRESANAFEELRNALESFLASAARQVAPPAGDAPVGGANGGLKGVGPTPSSSQAGGPIQGLLQIVSGLLQLMEQLFAQMGDSSGNQQGSSAGAFQPNSASGAIGSALPSPEGTLGGDVGGASPAGVPTSQTGPSGGASSSPVNGSNSLGPIGPANGLYDKEVATSAGKHGLEPALVKAVMAKESQGNTNAESSVGAAGLMQIKPATASELAGRNVTAAELKSNPALNIELGCKYLAQLKQQKGSTEDMLGAYNQGPNADWRASAEGQDYVKAIMEAVRSNTLPTWG